MFVLQAWYTKLRLVRTAHKEQLAVDKAMTIARIASERNISKRKAAAIYKSNEAKERPQPCTQRTISLHLRVCSDANDCRAIHHTHSRRWRVLQRMVLARVHYCAHTRP